MHLRSARETRTGIPLDPLGKEVRKLAVRSVAQATLECLRAAWSKVSPRTVRGFSPSPMGMGFAYWDMDKGAAAPSSV
jgi:hypothetical protein